jgi:ABC-2 type transport system permease protein
VTGALAFYLYRSFINRVAARIRRLRTPRYFISALAGLVYVYAAFLRQMVSGPRARNMPRLVADPDLLAAAEMILAVLLLLLVLAPWLSFTKPSALLFTDPEIQFLFPAPVSRRTLLRYRIVRGQIAVLFGVLVSFVIFGRTNLVPHRLYLLVTFWVGYSFLALYRMGTSLAKTSLAEHGAAGFRRQLWVVAAVVAVAGAIVAWLRWFLPPPMSQEFSSPAEAIAWLRALTEAGPAHFVLLPFRTLLRPASAPDLLTFLLRLIPALGILALTYGWVLTSDAQFEEASVERAEAMARRIEAARSGVSPRRSPGTPLVPFGLSPKGPAHIAFLWKNLISAGRINPWRLAGVVAVVVFAIALSSMSRQSLLMVTGGMAAGVAAFLTLLGPVVLRNDLRMDLLHLNMIKAYPIPGWRVVLGELLAPAGLLAAAEWFLVLIAAATLTGLGRSPWVPAQRFAFSLGAMLLFPCLSTIALLVQNGAALAVPGWVHLGRSQQRGIEAMGQRLITTVATVVVLAVAVIPAGAVFAAAYYPARWVLGAYAAIPLAAAVSCCALLFEAAAGIFLLGRMFDALDPSAEMMEV